MGNFSGKDLESHDLIEDPNAPGYLQRRRQVTGADGRPIHPTLGNTGVNVYGGQISRQEAAILQRYGINPAQLTPEQREALLLQERSRLEGEELRRRSQQQEQRGGDQHSNGSTITGLGPNVDGMTISTIGGQMDEGISVYQGRFSSVEVPAPAELMS